MIQVDWVLIRVTAVIAAIVLPIISSISIGGRGGEHLLRRYVRCLVAYVIAIALAEFGYVFQGLVTDAVRTRNFYSGWYWISEVFREYEYFAGFEEIVLVGCIIACAVLFARNARSRVVTGFRTAFVTYMSFDILNGMTTGYTMEQYIMCVAFNFVGSFFFGAACAFCFNRVVPLPAVRSQETNGEPASAGGTAVPL
jgi:hypothetical protein